MSVDVDATFESALALRLIGHMKDAGAGTRLDRRRNESKKIWHGARFLGFVLGGSVAGDMLPRDILSSLIGHGLACTRRALSLVTHKG